MRRYETDDFPFGSIVEITFSGDTGKIVYQAFALNTYIVRLDRDSNSIWSVDAEDLKLIEKASYEVSKAVVMQTLKFVQLHYDVSPLVSQLLIRACYYLGKDENWLRKWFSVDLLFSDDVLTRYTAKAIFSKSLSEICRIVLGEEVDND